MANVNADSNQSGNSIFENVYITGSLDYDFSNDDLTIRKLDVYESFFEKILIKDLTVSAGSSFSGIATFSDEVHIEDWIYHNNDFTEGEEPINPKTGRKVLDTKFGFPFENTFAINTNNVERLIINPEGFVGIATTNPTQRFQINSGTNSFVVTGVGTLGVGTESPGDFGINNTEHGQLKADFDGSIRVSRNIYDSSGSPGVNNYWMRRDENGIRWVPLTPEFKEGIFIQDEGIDIPSAGAAQSFTTINFNQKNSFGLGVDTLIPTAADTSTPGGSGLATVTTFDLWGHVDSTNTSSIYRMTKVGIKNSSPSTDLDISGTVHATLGVEFDSTLDVDGNTTLNSGLDVDGATTLNSTLDVDGGTTLNNTLDVDGATTLNSTLDVDGNTTLNAGLDVDGGTTLNSTLDVDGLVTFNDVTDASSTTSASVQIDGGVGIVKNLRIGGDLFLLDDKKALFGGDGDLEIFHQSSDNTSRILSDNKNLLIYTTGSANVSILSNSKNAVVASPNSDVALYFDNVLKFRTTGIGASVVGSLEIKDDLEVLGVSTVVGIATFKDDVGIAKTLFLKSFLRDSNNNTGVGIAKTDYRLASVGSGVSWRPSGVETENAIWVSVDGIDTNSGLLEGDAKRTIGAAAAVAQEGDTIIIRSGTYVENNPIGLRTDVSVSGEDLRLVTIVPENRNKDVFHVRRGCLIQNVNFSGPINDGQSGVSYDHSNCGAVAFPPTESGIAGGVDFQAVTGYIALGPANEGAAGRWRSPYIRNCTNFMTSSIGMKINGDYAEADFTGTNNLGQDLKSMVCDSFTQYNEAGIGVSVSNNAYAQLVSIFTIASEVGISAVGGGQCDLTNSNSSFGAFGLVADGFGRVEFSGFTLEDIPAELDVVSINGVVDDENNFRKPFDGQGVYFHINLADFDDTTVSGIVTQPLQLVRSITVTNGGVNGEYSAGAPPIVTVNTPLGPEVILPEFSPNVSAAGTITSIDVINSGRNFLPNQAINVDISGGGSATAIADMDPILFTVESSTEPDPTTGLCDVTFNEFIPYPVSGATKTEFVRLSRIITSSHSFEYVGAGTDINRANPFQGGVPVPENEIVAINGGQVPFTSTDQKGNFRIGDGLTIDQTTSTIRGRDFNRALQAQITPLILALR